MPERDHDRELQDYLAGRLSESQAEAFEESVLLDDELAAELEAAVEIRAAATGHRRRPLWGWLAAAALAAVAVGLGVLGIPGQEEPEPMRGESVPTELSVTREDATVSVSWAPGERTEGSYVLQIFEADGSLVAVVEGPSSPLAVELPPAVEDRLYARWQHLGPLREVREESPLMSVPPLESEP